MPETMLRTDARRWRNTPIFLPPLLAALQFKNPRVNALKQLDKVAWKALLLFSDRAHLTLLLSELPSNVLPKWVADRIRVNVIDNTNRIHNIHAAYRQIVQALGEAQVEHLVIKGFTQYPEFVRSANLRMQSDIDIFLPAKSIIPARDAILRIGYEEHRLPPNVFADHMPTLVRKTNWQWRGNLFDPEMPPSIELHFCLWNEVAAQFAIKECDRFWDRRAMRSVDGFDFVSLDPIDHVAFVSLHILRGLLRTEWIIHHVYELAYFLHTHSQDRTLWEKWRQLYSARMRSLQAIAFVLAKTWFHCDLPDEVERTKDELSPAIDHWFRHFSDSPLEWMFTPNHDSVWLHVSLVESFGAKVGIARRRLLPNRVPPLAVTNFQGSRTWNIAEKTSRYPAIRYMAYIAGRLHHFAHVFPKGIRRGLRWWLSQRQLGVRF